MEIYAHPDAVQNYYSNVIENSPGRYNDIDYPTQAAQFNEYRTQWNARVQNLVNKCANPMTGCPDCQVIFYSKDLWAGQSHLNLLADDLQEVIRREAGFQSFSFDAGLAALVAPEQIESQAAHA